MQKIKIFFILIFLGSISACVSLEEVDKIYLNDDDMKLSSGRSLFFEINAQTYKEGAAGANGSGKKGGGCGCN